MLNIEWYGWDNETSRLFKVEDFVEDESGICIGVLVYGIYFPLHKFTYFKIYNN